MSDSDEDIWGELKVSDFSQVFLFFDCDCHDSSASDDKLKKMLDFFDNETENGKLYISYPMIEAIRYTKELPDKNFYSYIVPISNCRDFKDIANDFSFYKNLDLIAFRTMKKSGIAIAHIPNEQKLEAIKQNWLLLCKQHLAKANYICMGKNEMPQNKIDVSQLNIFKNQKERYIIPNWLLLCKQHLAKANYICMGKNEMPQNKIDVSQSNIFKNQKERYIIPKNSVAVLCSFPLFLYEYFKM